MRAGKRERWVRYVNVCLGTHPPASLESQIQLLEIIKKIQKAIKGKERLQRKPKEAARQHVRLVDAELSSDKRYAVLLFRLIDKDAIDSAYEDFSDGEIEPHPKKPSQGNRVTAHLLIRIKASVKSGYRPYTALLEETPGLGASRIQPLLNSLAGKYGKGSYLDSAKKEHEFRCAVTVRPKVVGTIRDELSEGVLKGFTLVHSIPPVEANDEHVYFRERKRRLELDVVGVNVSDKLDSLWEAVSNKAAAEHYELVKATYENRDGRVVSVDLVAKQADALEELVTKTRKIDLSADTNYDQAGISPVVVSAMRDAFEKPE